MPIIAPLEDQSLRIEIETDCGRYLLTPPSPPHGGSTHHCK